MKQAYEFSKTMFESLLSFQLKNLVVLSRAGIFEELYKITDIACSEQGYLLEELKNE